MTRTYKPIAASALAGLLVAQLAWPAWAEDKAPEGPPTRAEFSKLQNDVREQRQLIIQMLQTEQQRYDMLLHLLQGQGGGVPAPGIAAEPTPQPPAGDAEAAGSSEKSAKKTAAVADHHPTSISGKVTVAGGPIEDVYVYVENVRMPVTHHKVVEIKQENRQFSPRVAVVQTGTNLIFPNMDSVYHNVFSNSPRNTFDLGTYQAGEQARSVTVTGPGVVEIFCNIHQKMSAKVLVVPSILFAKVQPDGTFRINNVPPGMRRLVAWSPETKAAVQKVTVNGPTEVSFALEHDEGGAHTNKFGQAYGSYK